MPKHSSHILELAKRGAEHRYQELKAEVDSLVKLFPRLAGRRGRQVSVLDVVMGGAPVRRRKRKAMSVAARKAVSARMKKFWAAKRKTKKR